MSASRRARAVVNGDVDESLFGLSQADAIKQRKQNTPATLRNHKNSKNSSISPAKTRTNIGKFLNSSSSALNNSGAVISSSTLSKLTSPAPKSALNDSVTLTAREIHEIASLSTSQRELQAQQRARFEQTQRSELAAKAQQRKDKMLALNQTANNLQSLDNDEDRFAWEDTQARHKLLTEARQAIDENHDDVKHMNQIMLYAQCVTIRDAQILEKRAKLQQRLQEEKELDEEMEAERVRQIELQQEREIQRAQEQRDGARVIIKQIEERELSRVRGSELREQEAQAMLERIREAEAEEEAGRQRKIDNAKKMVAAVVEANNEQAKNKLLRKAEEIEEDLRIASYLKYKEQREFEEEQGKAAIKASKEKEISRLRAEQERAQDRQSQIDELRARRYQEQRDRKWREVEAAEARKRSLMRSEIQGAREQQQQEKSKRITEQAVAEREEYQRIVEWQQTQAEIDRARYEKAAKVKSSHASELKSQMEKQLAAKEAAKKAYLTEGKDYDKQLEADRARLTKIKTDKLAELERMGVPQKYRAELAKKKVLVAKIH
jgi:hypothetical protein